LDWPLSSIGAPAGEPPDGRWAIDGFAGDACLMALYADRIIAADAVSRLNDDRVKRAVRTALGAHDELAPRVTAALQ
jgi:hypothetical protein